MSAHEYEAEVGCIMSVALVRRVYLGIASGNGALHEQRISLSCNMFACLKEVSPPPPPTAFSRIFMD